MKHTLFIIIAIVAAVWVCAYCVSLAEINRANKVLDEYREFVKSSALAEVEELPAIDSAKLSELLPYFDVERDKFSPAGRTWYKPKSRPKYVDQNGIYCYFSKDGDGRPDNLRLKIQYEATEWLFIQRIYFSVGDRAYSYTPGKVEHDNAAGYIWEWTDEPVDNVLKTIINALSEQSSAEMKLSGRHYYSIKPITTKQIESIKRTVELYSAMGGKY